MEKSAPRPYAALGAAAAGAGSALAAVLASACCVMDRRLFWLSASLLMLAACGPGAASPGHTVLSGDLSQLRARFNADTGKVRAIFLAAPT